MELVHRGDCGGSAVTMPHKAAIMSRPEIKEIAPQALLIGAVNTLYWRQEQDGGEKKLVATNTDVAGIRDSIRTKVSPQELQAFQGLAPQDKIGMVVGGGGTTRTAVITLRMDLGCTGPIYIINRFKHEVDAIVADFAAKGVTDIHHLSSPQQVQELLTSQGKRPHYIVNAIPSMEPTTEEEKAARATLVDILALANPSSPSTQPGLPRAFLEMCYFPHVWTDACTLAQDQGWNVVSGEECMYLQGVAQQLLWAGEPPQGVDLCDVGRKAAEIEMERRKRGEEFM